MAPDCLFCKIIAGQIPTGIVHRDEHLTAIRDINPRAPTHILVMPNRHIAGVADAGAADQELLGALLLAAAGVARQEGIADAGYRVVINHGADGGQTVGHLHVHVLGGRPMHWPPG